MRFDRRMRSTRERSAYNISLRVSNYYGDRYGRTTEFLRQLANKGVRLMLLINKSRICGDRQVVTKPTELLIY